MSDTKAVIPGKKKDCSSCACFPSSVSPRHVEAQLEPAVFREKTGLHRPVGTVRHPAPCSRVPRPVSDNIPNWP